MHIGIMLVTSLLSAPSAKTTDLGHLPATTRDMVQKDPTVEELELVVHPDGTIWKVIAEHKPNTPIPEAIKAAAKKLWPESTNPFFSHEQALDYGPVVTLGGTVGGNTCILAMDVDTKKTVYSQCDVKIEQIPGFVTKAIKDKFPTADIVGGGHREHTSGLKEVWATFKVDGVKHRMIFTPEQKLLRHGVWYEGDLILETST